MSPISRVNFTRDKEKINMAWLLDSSHSTLKFQARHLMISNVNGNFER